MEEEELKSLIKSYLIQYPHLRNSELKIVSTIWQRELKKDSFHLNTRTAFEFLKLFSDGKLTSIDEIIEIKNNIQEKHNYLRPIK
jgi:hypothetical protein